MHNTCVVGYIYYKKTCFGHRDKMGIVIYI